MKTTSKIYPITPDTKKTSDCNNYELDETLKILELAKKISKSIENNNKKLNSEFFRLSQNDSCSFVELGEK